MAHIGIIHAKMVKEIETCIKDDLAHTPLYSLPMHSIYTLQALYEQDGRMASDLAKAISTPPTSFTPVLDRLEKLGLIERIPHTDDRRAILVVLTKEGKKYKAAVGNAIGNAEVRYGGK